MNIQIDQARLNRIMSPDFHLRSGKGSGINGKQDACAQQALRYALGLDSASDECPECVSQVIHAYSMSLNDKMPNSYRDKLKECLILQVGTRGSIDLEIRRGFAIADHAVRVTAANALDEAGLKSEGDKLRALPKIESEDAARAASYAARAASYAARAASYAARAARAARAASYAASIWDAEIALLKQLCEMKDDESIS